MSSLNKIRLQITSFKPMNFTVETIGISHPEEDSDAAEHNKAEILLRLENLTKKLEDDYQENLRGDNFSTMRLISSRKRTVQMMQHAILSEKFSATQKIILFSDENYMTPEETLEDIDAFEENNREIMAEDPHAIKDDYESNIEMAVRSAIGHRQNIKFLGLEKCLSENGWSVQIIPRLV